MSSSLPSLEQLTDQTSWNRRYREMQELVHKSPEARKLVATALLIISKKKDLSFGERKMLDQPTLGEAIVDVARLAVHRHPHSVIIC